MKSTSCGTAFETAKNVQRARLLVQGPKDRLAGRPPASEETAEIVWQIILRILKKEAVYLLISIFAKLRPELSRLSRIENL